MKIVWNYLGIILIISAFFRIPPILVAFFSHESMGGFVITALISICVGSMLYYSFRREKGHLTLTYGLILTALSFIVIPLISSIAFLPIFNYNFLDAFFETISGFTTTGLSVIDGSLSEIPKSILLWRAETQWMGGIGIVIVFLFILSRLRGHTYKTDYISERGKDTESLYMSSGFPERIDPTIKKTTFHIIFIYCLYTFLGIILLWVWGMHIVEAIGMAFTSLSTGGFTMGDSFYTNNWQLVVLSLLMILGSISFIAHSNLIKLKISDFFANTELRMFLWIFLFMFIIAYPLFRKGGVLIFQLISSFTTTGYAMTEISLLPQLIIFLIMLSMIIGGAIGSTAGGLKIYRAVTLVKGIPWLIRRLSNPSEAVILFKMGGRVMEEKDLLITYIYIGCYLFILIVGTITFMLFGHNFFDSSFQMVSALGTVGLSTVQLGSINFVLKIVLMIAMVLGRLEIFPLLVLVGRLFKRA